MFTSIEIPRKRDSANSKRTIPLTPSEQYAQLEDGGEIFSHRIKACSGAGWFRPDNPSIAHHEATQLRIAVTDSNVWLVVFAWFGDFRKLFYIHNSNINTNLDQPVVNAVADPLPEQCVRLNISVPSDALDSSAYDNEAALIAHLFEYYKTLSHLEKGDVHSHGEIAIVDSNYLQQEINNDDDGYTLSANQVAAYWCVEKGLISRRPKLLYKSKLMNMQIRAGRRRFPLVYEPQLRRDRKAYQKVYSVGWRAKRRAQRKEMLSAFSPLVDK